MVKYEELKKSLITLEKRIDTLICHNKLLIAPQGYLEYQSYVLDKLGTLGGYPMHTLGYNEILAKFLTDLKDSFFATWTIEINLQHMNDTYKEQQKKRINSKKRVLFLSKSVLRDQLTNNLAKVKEFVDWHKKFDIPLYWMDREKLVQKLLALGKQPELINKVLSQCEDFIALDKKVILFYDTEDSIMEGGIPNPGISYSISLTRMDDLLNDKFDLEAKDLVACILSAETSKGLVKIENVNDVKDICAKT